MDKKLAMSIINSAKDCGGSWKPRNDSHGGSSPTTPTTKKVKEIEKIVKDEFVFENQGRSRGPLGLGNPAEEIIYFYQRYSLIQDDKIEAFFSHDAKNFLSHPQKPDEDCA